MYYEKLYYIYVIFGNITCAHYMFFIRNRSELNIMILSALTMVSLCIECTAYKIFEVHTMDFYAFFVSKTKKIINKMLLGFYI